MTEARIKVWRKKIASGPVKLCDIPPTNKGVPENIKRAILSSCPLEKPPDINPTDYGYEAQPTATGSILVPQPVPHGTKDAPDLVREMINCGCEITECVGERCKCNSIGCAVFCNYYTL